MRSLERIGLELAEGRPIDALLDAFTTGRTVLSPSTWKKAGQAFGSGPTPRNPGATGTPGPDSLANAPGRLAQVLTAGTRANASLDEVVRSANEAGARAVAARRGLSGQALDDFVRQAGDYATITGPNSPVAHALNKAKAWVSEPGSSPAQKTVGYVAQALSGYVSMPERILVAALSSTASPLTGALGLGKAALTRDPTLARKAAGRLIYGSVLDYKLAQAAAGDTPGFHVYGPPPRDQALRRELEREGARWDSFVLGDPTSPDAKVIPTRYAGVFGQQASLIGSLHTAAVLADRKGDTGPIKALRLGNQLLKWTLDESYLSDYADFGAKVQDLGGIQYAVGTAAGIPARLGNIVSGPINASDPYERDTRSYEGFGGIVARTLPGGRYLLPEKIEPTTGEPMRRRGSGWDRYWGPQGTEQRPEAVELTRLELTPHEFRSGEYAGVEQTPAALKQVKQTVGSETGKAVREVMATPAYKEADDVGKKAQLQQALRDADFAAELRLGDTVKRSPRQQADWEYGAVPRYQGIKKDAPAEEVRRYNRDVAAAKRARTEARKKYPNAPDKGQTEWARANPELNRLANRGEADAATLRKRREEIDQKYGVNR